MFFDWITPARSLLSGDVTVRVPERDMGRVDAALRKQGIKPRRPNYTNGWFVFDVKPGEESETRRILQELGLL